MVYPYTNDDEQSSSSNLMQAMMVSDEIASYSDQYDIGAMDKLAISVKAGLYGMANNFIQIGNAFGGDSEVYDIGEELDANGDQGDYYRANKTTFDLAGDVITSFIPGLGAMKLIKLAKLGKLGSSFKKGSTYFEQQSKANASQIAEMYSQVGSAAKVGGLKRKVFGYETAQQAMEGAIVGVATEASLNLGDIINDEGLTGMEKVGEFLTSSVIWGAAIPAPIIAGFTYNSTLAVSKNTLREFNLSTQAFTPRINSNIRTNSRSTGDTHGDDILGTMAEYERIEALPTLDKEGLKSVQSQALISLETTLTQQITDLLPKAVKGQPTKDISDLRNFMTESIKTPEGREIVREFVSGSSQFKHVSSYQSGAKAQINKAFEGLSPTYISSKKMKEITDNNYMVVEEGGKRKLLIDNEYADDLNVRAKAVAHYNANSFLSGATNKVNAITLEVQNFKIDSGLPDAMDEYELVASMYAARSAGIREFKKVHPKVSDYFKGLGEDAELIYGRNDIKYLDVRTGNISVAPVTHIGDMKGITTASAGKQITFEDGSNIVNISKSDSGTIDTITNLLKFQGTRVLASRDASLLHGVTSLEGMNTAQLMRLETLVIKTLDDAVIDVPTNVTYLNNRKKVEIDIKDAIREIVKSKNASASRLLADADTSGMALDDVANSVGMSTDFIENMGVLTDDVLDDMLNPLSKTDIKSVLNTADDLMERRTYASIQNLDAVKSPAEDGYVLYSESKRAGLLTDLRNRASNLLGVELTDILPEFKIDVTVPNLNTRRFFQDAATLGETMGIEASTARIGDWISKQSDEVFNVDILPALQQAASTLSNSKPALAEMAAFNHWYATRPEKYIQVARGVWLEEGLVPIARDKIAKGGDLNAILDNLVQGKNYYKLNNEETISYVNTIQRLNNTHISSKQIKIEQAYGNNIERNTEHLYMPPTAYEHVTYMRVKASSPLDNHSSSMMRITGVDADDLSEKVASAVKYGSDKGWELVERADVEAYARARDVFEWSGKDITSSVVNSMMKRKGGTPNLFPTVDPTKILVEQSNWFKRVNKTVHQSAVEMHYADSISSLNYLIDREKANARSHIDTVSGVLKVKGQAVPEKAKIGNYETLRNQMLGIDDSGFSVWKIANNRIEDWAAKAFTPIAKVIKNIRKKDLSSDEWGEHIDLMEAELKANGIGTPIKDVLIKQLSQESNLDRKDIIEIASKLNFIQSMLLLRTDQADSIVNVLGYAVKAGTEITALNQMVAKGGDASKSLYDQTVRELFGTGSSSGLGINAFGIGKAVAIAIKEMHSPTGKDNIARWKELRLLTDADTINRDLFEEVRISATDLTPSNLEGFKKKLNDTGSKAMKAATYLNDKSNIVGQYTSLMIAEKLGKAAGLEGGKLNQFMFSFNRRTNVLSTPTQKPRLFQGAVGVSISLYQSYVFHTMANLFRYAEQGGTKAPLMFAGLNATFFGAKSIPGFEYMNQKIGLSNSDKGNNDLYGAAHIMFDDDIANFILYGGASSLLQTNIHTRGDLNPRQATLIPTSFSEVPVANTLLKVSSSIYDNAAKFMGGSQGMGQTIWNTIADSGLSRPLTGLTAVIQGRSVDSNHATVMFHNDIVDMTTPMRLAGMKPFNEQFVRDYQFRTKSYNIANNQRKKNLGENIRLMYENDPNQFNNVGFTSRLANKYVKAGGSLDRFDTFLMDSLVKANKDLSVRIEDDLSSNASAIAQYKLFMQGGD